MPPLDESDLQQIRAIFRTEISRGQVTDQILTRDEAVAYVKASGRKSFYNWSKRWECRSTTNGRYGRSQLDAALAREAMGGRYGPRRRGRKLSEGSPE